MFRKFFLFSSSSDKVCAKFFMFVSKRLVFRRETCCSGLTRPVWTGWPTARPWPPSRPPSASAASPWSSWRSVAPRRDFGNGQNLIELFVRGQRPALGRPILFRVGCFGRNFPDSCSIPKLSSCTGETARAGDSPLWVSSILKQKSCCQPRGCWRSVQRRNTQCTFLFAHKRILKTLTYILYFSQGISRISMSLQCSEIVSFYQSERNFCNMLRHFKDHSLKLFSKIFHDLSPFENIFLKIFAKNKSYFSLRRSRAR